MEVSNNEHFRRKTTKNPNFNESKLLDATSDEEIDLELEYERVTKQRYEDFQEWLNKCPLVVTDYQDYTNEFVVTFNLIAD